ncbi:MAG: twin-arginine translocation signal domain-containing protein [Hyphomicrobiaceae bacterium]
MQRRGFLKMLALAPVAALVGGPVAREDSLPEGRHFKDTGCSHQAYCLYCPFAYCAFNGGGIDPKQRPPLARNMDEDDVIPPGSGHIPRRWQGRLPPGLR